MSRPAVYPRPVDCSLRVRYAETDRMGIVYHANYIVWFEIGRTEFCREVGLPYAAMEEQGVFILVTGVDGKFRGPARYDDEVLVRTRMGEIGSRGLSFFYEIQNGSGALLAEGSTRHLFVDSENRLIAIPESIRRVFLDFVRA